MCREEKDEINAVMTAGLGVLVWFHCVYCLKASTTLDVTSACKNPRYVFKRYQRSDTHTHTHAKKKKKKKRA